MVSDGICGKRKIGIALGIAALVLLMAGGAGAVTITVDDSGGAMYTRIQDAINASNAGDTILVYSGMYYENVNVTKQLTMRGIGMPVVDARGSGSAITLNAEGCVLEGFATTGASNPNYGPMFGIKVVSGNNVIKNNTASNSEYGIGLWSSSISNNMLVNNSASNNQIGIEIHGNNNILIGNNASSNNYEGIDISSSNSNILTSVTSIM